MKTTGITVLYPEAEDIDANQNLGLDIIAVHGLKGDSFRTWTEPKSKKLWLRDFLPQDLPRTRIMTFRYRAAPVFQDSVAGIEEHARGLLGALAERREGNALKRPLIFVGHSLGGLLIKQALVIAAREGSAMHPGIFNSTKGVVFFGTPHQGSKFGTYGGTLAKLANTPALSPAPELLNSLQNGGERLLKLTGDFKALLDVKAFSIVTFYETKTIKLLWGNLVVEKESALLTPPGETPTYESQIPVEADHREMCRFSTPKDKTYKTFVSKIKVILKGGKEVQNVHYEVPREVNAHFTGCQDIRQRLTNALITDRQMKASAQHRFVLHGLGGSGKTQLALKFAQDYREGFWGIFWIDASRIETMQESFLAIARKANQEEDVDSVITWLSGKDDWLLIFDNADNPAMDLARFFPVGNRGTVLITSRNPECRQYATAGSCRIDEMGPDDAVALLFTTALIENQQGEATRKCAEKVVKVLGYLALAIVQAGAVIRQQLCSLDGFCGVYAKQKIELLESGSPRHTGDYQYSVYTTWEISIGEIQKMSNKHSRFALDLLRIFSCMHFDRISEDIFKRVATAVLHWELESGIIDETMLVKMMPSGWDPLLMGKALSILVSFSLITIDRTRHLSIHPLVHEWSRNRMSEEEQSRSWRETAAILAMSTTFSNTHTDQQQRRALLPHIDACLRCDCSGLLADGPDGEERFLIAFKFAIAYDDSSRSEQALELKLRILQILPPDHPAKLTTMNHVGKTLHDLHRYDEAMAMHRAALQASMGQKNDCNAFAAMIGMGAAHLYRGEVDKALEMCLEATKKFEVSFKKDSTEMLSAWSLISQAYLSMGRAKEAAKFSEMVLESRREGWGESHEMTLAAMGDVAAAYKGMGLHKKARLVQEKCVQLMKESLGISDRRTIIAQDYLAKYQSTGPLRRTRKAIEYRKEMLRYHRTDFGEADPRTLYCMEHLAADFYLGGFLEKAHGLQETVVKETTKTFGRDHSVTVRNLEALERTRKTILLRKKLYWWVPKGLLK